MGHFSVFLAHTFLRHVSRSSLSSTINAHSKLFGIFVRSQKPSFVLSSQFQEGKKWKDSFRALQGGEFFGCFLTRGSQFILKQNNDFINVRQEVSPCCKCCKKSPPGFSGSGFLYENRTFSALKLRNFIPKLQCFCKCLTRCFLWIRAF